MTEVGYPWTSEATAASCLDDDWNGCEPHFQSGYCCKDSRCYAGLTCWNPVPKSSAKNGTIRMERCRAYLHKRLKWRDDQTCAITRHTDRPNPGRFKVVTFSGKRSAPFRPNLPGYRVA